MEILNVINYFSAFLTLIYVFVVITFIWGWRNISIFKTQKTSLKTRVSIIIAARNEEQNIAQTIEDVLAQDYDKQYYELIIIDDHSTDKTAAIVTSYAQHGVKLISLKLDHSVNSYKKKAIQTAIGEAKGDLIVTTDADCSFGKRWLSTVVAYYETTGCKMISSPVAYFKENSNFEKMQSLEFAYLIGMGASTIGNNKPSTCNGANLAYEKKAFFEVGGFQGIDDLASGDDELLLHKMAARYGNKIGFIKHLDAVVYTTAKETLAEFIQQRKRWASKSTRYKNKLIIALGVTVWLFNLNIILNALLALFFPVVCLPLLIVQLLAKLLIELSFMQMVMRFFKRSSLLLWLPAVSVLHVIYIVYIGVAGNSGKYNWKGRMVN